MESKILTRYVLVTSGRAVLDGLYTSRAEAQSHARRAKWVRDPLTVCRCTIHTDKHQKKARIRKRGQNGKR